MNSFKYSNTYRNGFEHNKYEMGNECNKFASRGSFLKIGDFRYGDDPSTRWECVTATMDCSEITYKTTGTGTELFLYDYRKEYNTGNSFTERKMDLIVNRKIGELLEGDEDDDEECPKYDDTYYIEGDEDEYDEY